MMILLIAGILSFGAATATVLCLLTKASGDAVDREYEDQQQIKFLEEWKRKKK